MSEIKELTTVEKKKLLKKISSLKKRVSGAQKAVNKLIGTVEDMGDTAYFERIDCILDICWDSKIGNIIDQLEQAESNMTSILESSND